MPPTYPTGITPHPNHPPQTAKAPVLYACMHLYASRDAYRKSPEKARKPLYIKEKTKFLSLVCIVCINIWGLFPFSRILYKGMMHTMHTRAEAAPGTLEPSRNGKKRRMHPRMHTDAYTRTGMHTRPRTARTGTHTRGHGIRDPRDPGRRLRARRLHDPTARRAHVRRHARRHARRGGHDGTARHARRRRRRTGPDHRIGHHGPLTAPHAPSDHSNRRGTGHGHGLNMTRSQA